MAKQLFPDQRSLTDQLTDLVRLAIEHGLYDAADWVRERAEMSASPTGGVGSADSGTGTGTGTFTGFLGRDAEGRLTAIGYPLKAAPKALLWPVPPLDPRFTLAFSVRLEDDVRGKGSVRVVKTKKKSGQSGVRGVPEEKSAAWEKKLGMLCGFQKPKSSFVLPLTGPLIVRVLTGKKRPATIPMKHRFPLDPSKPDDLMLCPVKPDWDNIGKSVCDGLVKGRVLIEDSRIVDGQVVNCWARKGGASFTEMFVYATRTGSRY